MKIPPKILIYGYGNPGRQDDGLGNSFVDILEKFCQENNISNVSFDSNYQLNIEDAVDLINYDMVIFVDASIEDAVDDFSISQLEPNDKVNFSMHSTSVEYILHVCNKMYGSYPPSYLIHIKGYEWEMFADMTSKATSNLSKAVNYAKSIIQNPVLLLNEQLVKT